MLTQKHNKAFTLIELIVVITIVTILAAGLIGVATQIGARNAEKDTKAVLNTMDKIIAVYFDTMGQYPNQAIDCTEDAGTEDMAAYPESTIYDQTENTARFDAAKRNNVFLVKQLRRVDACSKALDTISSKRLIKISDQSFDVFDKNYDAVGPDVPTSVQNRYDYSSDSDEYFEVLVDGYNNPINYQLLRKRGSSGKWIGNGRPLLVSAGSDGEFGTFRDDEYMLGAAKDDLRSDAK